MIHCYAGWSYFLLQHEMRIYQSGKGGNLFYSTGAGGSFAVIMGRSCVYASGTYTRNINVL
jgi:photosystem II stability/assembly factor-like uncharacterized protein